MEHKDRSFLNEIHSKILDFGKRSIFHLLISGHSHSNSSQGTASLICVRIENNWNFQKPIYSLVTAYHALSDQVVNNLNDYEVRFEFVHNQMCNFILKNEDLGNVRVYKSQEDIDITMLEFSPSRQRKLDKLDAYFLDIGIGSVGTKVVLQGFPKFSDHNKAKLFNSTGTITEVIDSHRFKTSATGPPGYSGGVLLAEVGDDVTAVAVHCRYAPDDVNHNIAFNLIHLPRLIIEENLNPDVETSLSQNSYPYYMNMEQVQSILTVPSSSNGINLHNSFELMH